MYVSAYAHNNRSVKEEPVDAKKEEQTHQIAHLSGL